MRRFLLFLLIPFGVLPARAVDNWKLVWSDEFDGNSLDLTKWEFEVGGKGGGNHELQYYTTNNATVHDGKLFIEARKESFTGRDGTLEFTSARIRTKLKGDWKYGRFDVSAKLPLGKGIWPAIWMMPTDSKYGGWPHSGEIDIMELLGHQPNRVHGTLHYDDAAGRHAQKGQQFTLPAGDFSRAFHLFRLEWEPGVMRWYVDSTLYQTQTNWTSKSAPFPAPFDQRFHFILNVAVGGDWPGAPDATTKFPQAMVVDYARVYQRE